MREATRDDIPRIVDMGQRFLQSTPYRDAITENPVQMQALATHLVTSSDGVVFVADVDDRVVGMIGALVYAHHMSGARVAGELFWWVEPERRGIGLRLLRAAERWAKAQGAASLQMIAPTPDVERLYERLGYVPIERTYQRAL